MGVGQDAFPQLGLLGLGPIIIREDMSQGDTFGVHPPVCHLAVCHGPGNRAPLVYDQPPCQPFSVSHAALGKFADNRAGLVSTNG